MRKTMPALLIAGAGIFLPAAAGAGTVEDAQALGNRTHMSEPERETLGRWLKEQP